MNAVIDAVETAVRELPAIEDADPFAAAALAAYYRKGLAAFDDPRAVRLARELEPTIAHAPDEALAYAELRAKARSHRSVLGANGAQTLAAREAAAGRAERRVSDLERRRRTLRWWTFGTLCAAVALFALGGALLSAHAGALAECVSVASLVPLLAAGVLGRVVLPGLQGDLAEAAHAHERASDEAQLAREWLRADQEMRAGAEGAALDRWIAEHPKLEFAEWRSP